LNELSETLVSFLSSQDDPKKAGLADLLTFSPLGQNYEVLAIGRLMPVAMFYAEDEHPAGFRAAFKVERGRKDHYGTYITPCFVVATSGYGKGETRFLTTLLGFDGAFAAAAEHYCTVIGSARSSLQKSPVGTFLFIRYGWDYSSAATSLPLPR